MKFKPKNDTCGVPERGYIKAKDYNQQDEDNLRARAKSRGKDFTQFMLGCGFVPVNAQLEIDIDEEVTVATLEPMEEEEKPKRKRRTKAEIEAEK